MIPVPTQFLGMDTIQRKIQEFHLTIDTEFIPTRGIEATQIVENNDIKTIDQGIFPTVKK